LLVLLVPRLRILSIRGRRSTNSPAIFRLVGTTTPDQTTQAPRDTRSELPAAGTARAARLLGSVLIEDEGRVLADVGYVDRVDPALVG
jgi:hypothetical protein